MGAFVAGSDNMRAFARRLLSSPWKDEMNQKIWRGAARHRPRMGTKEGIGTPVASLSAGPYVRPYFEP